MILNNPYKNIYGLTGCIGSGKSTVGNLLKEMGAIVINADELSREIFTPHYNKYIKVIESLTKKIEPLSLKTLKKSIFYPNTTNIDRMILGELVFNNPKILKKLNTITHPHIRILFKQKIDKIDKNKIIIYDIPLLFEGNLQHLFKNIIVVYSKQEICVSRIMKRNLLTSSEALKRLSLQISIEEKRNKADYLIDNQGDMNHLKQQVEKFWQFIN